MGATIDLNILFHMMNAEIDFCMEVTEKTRSDVKGGLLFLHKGETVKLMEMSQVPAAHEKEVRSKKYNLFNSNNLWVNLRAMQRAVATDSLSLNVIANEKYLNQLKVLQFETAAGSAVSHFAKSIGIKVPRSRFLPVKTTGDLLAMQSNLYTVRHGKLILNTSRQSWASPVIKLGAEFTTIEEYAKRFAQGVPDMLDLDHLTVSGDVCFGSGVVLKGTVIIVADNGAHVDVPRGSVLENNIISGSLRILP